MADGMSSLVTSRRATGNRSGAAFVRFAMRERHAGARKETIMAARSFLPTRDTALLRWSLNFSTLINNSPESFGLSAPLAASYAALHAAFATAMEGVEPGIRNQSAVAGKNAARRSLKINAGLLSRLVQGTGTVSDAQKRTLALNVRARPTPVAAPAFAPGVEVVWVRGFSAKLRLLDTQTIGRRAKPAGVSGASVFTHVGPGNPPANIADWNFHGNTGRTTTEVHFPATLPAGATVWFTAFWFNPRKQSGPATAPVGANLPGGGVTTKTMTIAA
jgi:hypothetical protein